MAQIFIGHETFVADVYGMKSMAQFTSTLEDNIRKRGAMSKLISDRAEVEISQKAHDILRAYAIDDWQSEPYHQHQNFAERRWGVIKAYTNNTLNRTGAPASTWLLCLMWVCLVMNHLATAQLDYRTPIEALTGQTPDISALLSFHFWEPVYYLDPTDEEFPSATKEKSGRFVGIAESVGDALTYKILTDDTKQVLYRSTVCSALVPSEHNLRLPHLEDDDSSAPQVIRSWVPLKGEKLQGEHASTLLPMHTIAPDELIGHSILLDANLYHDLITGNAATGILHLVNGTPVDWYSKRQATVETATYGSEFVAAHIATDQVIDLRTTLRYLGVPVKSKSYMFGDNNSVVQSSTLPHSGLNKRHNALSYHRVHEAIAAKILGFFHIDGKKNPADVLSKHGGFPQMWPLIKPLLFWRGDTVKCSDGVAEKTLKLKQD